MTADEYLECGRRPNGRLLFRVRVLHWLAVLFGVQFKIGGWPCGASYERAVNHRPRREGRLNLVSYGQVEAQ